MDVSWDADGLARLARVAPALVDQVTEAVADDERRFAPVDTGQLRASIRTLQAGQHGYVVTGTDHWIFPEFGTRYQAAQPYIRPAAYRRRALRPVVV